MRSINWKLSRCYLLALFVLERREAFIYSLKKKSSLVLSRSLLLLYLIEVNRIEGWGEELEKERMARAS